jgi:hypothetical protein
MDTVAAVARDTRSRIATSVSQPAGVGARALCGAATGEARGLSQPAVVQAVLARVHRCRIVAPGLNT